MRKSLVSFLVVLCIISIFPSLVNASIIDYAGTSGGAEDNAWGVDTGYGSFNDGNGAVFNSQAWAVRTDTYSWNIQSAKYMFFNFTTPIDGSTLSNVSFWVYVTASTYAMRFYQHFDDGNMTYTQFDLVPEDQWNMFDMTPYIWDNSTLVAIRWFEQGTTTAFLDDVEILVDYVEPVAEPDYIVLMIGLCGIVFVLLGFVLPAYMVSNHGFMSADAVKWVGYGFLSVLIGYGLMRTWLFGGFV